jgi:SAM-dependent methyltransferase
MSYLTKSKSVWNTLSDTFGTTILHPQYFAKRYAWEAILLAQKESSGILLDIGCGRMPYRTLILPKVKKYIGLDHPETAKMYQGAFKPDIYADATKIPLSSNSIDTILMFMVLEHLPDPRLALAETRRLLKPGKGKLILSTVQMYPIHDAPYDYFRYTRYGLKVLLEEAGFTIKKMLSQGSFWSFWGLSLNVYLFQTILTLLQNRKTVVLGIILSPLFYLLSLATNICLFLPDRLSNSVKSKFNISHAVFAVRK